MREYDCRLDLIAVLAPRSRPAGVNDIALLEQFRDGEFGRVHGDLSRTQCRGSPRLRQPCPLSRRGVGCIRPMVVRCLPPLPHSGVDAENHIDRGGEGAETTRYRQLANAPTGVNVI